jgi:AraC family transcriptional regulator
MHPVAKALWYIESHFAGEISLDQIASVGGVSRFHMSRAFGTATGQSVMRYVRGRRLSEAARALANGAPDILSVALDAGYGSHEAFTRAFRDQFGMTPETVRAQRSIDNLALVTPIRMDPKPMRELEPPRKETGRTLLIAGHAQRYRFETIAGIPAQWQRFAPHIGNIEGQIGRIAYGVCHNSDSAGSFEYLCGVEVAGFGELSDDVARLRIPERTYLVFAHREHISAIGQTWSAIMNKYLPESGLEVADAPDFERYGEDFNPQTGTGLVEIWIPIKA